MVFCKKGVLRNLTKFAIKHLHLSPFFNKVAGQSKNNYFEFNGKIKQQLSCTAIEADQAKLCHHPPPAKIHPLRCPTTHLQPKCIHHHQQQSKIYPSKKLFYKKNIKMFYSKVNDKKYFD